MSAYSYDLQKLEVFDAWNDFLRLHRLTCKISIIDILNENYAFSTTRKKKVYPVITFHETKSGKQLYKKADLENWFYKLIVQLKNQNKVR